MSTELEQQTNTLDVPRLVDTVGQGYKQLQISVAAYGALMRVVEEAQAGGQRSSAPLMTWPARCGDTMVEVYTDLSRVPAADIPGVLGPLVNVHAAQMEAAVNQIYQASGVLLQLIQASRQAAAVPQPPANAT